MVDLLSWRPSRAIFDRLLADLLRVLDGRAFDKSARLLLLLICRLLDFGLGFEDRDETDVFLVQVEDRKDVIQGEARSLRLFLGVRADALSFILLPNLRVCRDRRMVILRQVRVRSCRLKLRLWLQTSVLVLCTRESYALVRNERCRLLYVYHAILALFLLVLDFLLNVLEVVHVGPVRLQAVRLARRRALELLLGLA